MDWPETLDISLDGIAQGGEGVGRWQDRVIFVAGGLPGEQVRVKLHERHAAFARGSVAELLEASPERVAPRLPGADWMPWQHIAYPAQLRFKRQILAEQLAKIGDLAGVAVGETLPSAREWGYRNSTRMHIQGTLLGYYAAGTHDIQDVEADPLLLPALNEALASLRRVLGAGAPERCEVALRGSESYGYPVAALRSGEARDEAQSVVRALAARWRADCPALAGVLIQNRPPVQIGADHLIEELGGIAFRLRPTTFFQVNQAAAETLLRLAREGLALRAEQHLLDLYCGAGAFTLPLAAEVAQVVGVEEHAGAIADAEASAFENGIGNVRFETGSVERVLERLDESFDAVLLDPPRRGCHPQALAALLRLAPARIVYVSCHPATLARDLKTLVAGGYAVTRVQPVDLFPQTPHIESVSVLAR
jgi:23S rRNA (uracil1939-C5)-methyltransferase